MNHPKSSPKPVLAKFILLSFIGILIFLTPITADGQSTILMAVIMGYVRVPFESWMTEFIVGFVFLTVVGGALHLTLKPGWITSRPTLSAMCETTPGWLFMRALGLAIGLMVYFGFGPEALISEDTGGTVVTIIGPGLFFTVGVACVLLPTLTDFGLLEFTGTLLRKPFGRVFTLPGRAAIDATSSIVAAASVGLMLTIKQYEDGRYSAREAASVATNFSIVSLPFSLVIASVAKVEFIFFPWYLTVIAGCLICAMVMVRLKPLKALPETFFNADTRTVDEHVPDDKSTFRWAVEQAVDRAANAPALPLLLLDGFKAAMKTLAKVSGPSLAIATLGGVLVFHTPVVELAAWPILQILEFLSLPNAEQAAPGFIAGFMEQLLPALVAANIESDLTRFILAGLGVSQLIYMSEVGVIILRSSLPLGFLDLVKIFLLRTVILFPVFYVAGTLLL